GEQRKEKKPKKIEEEKKSATKDTGGKRSGRMKVTPSKEKDREGKQRKHREKSKTSERTPIEVRGKPTPSQIHTAAERAIEDMNRRMRRMSADLKHQRETQNERAKQMAEEMMKEQYRQMQDLQARENRRREEERRHDALEHQRKMREDWNRRGSSRPISRQTTPDKRKSVDTHRQRRSKGSESRSRKRTSVEKGGSREKRSKNTASEESGKE
ncbi:MAG: hypothetical protein GY821_13850, partial [Gammaproteobacteria bacterium]|nr:hypothetical protein [Gammaproteobacteria bacterium]